MLLLLLLLLSATLCSDPDYLFDFLVTYEYFMSSATLLSKLVDVYFRAAYARDAEASSGSGGGSPGSSGGGGSFGRKVASRRSSRPHFRTLGKVGRLRFASFLLCFWFCFFFFRVSDYDGGWRVSVDR